MTDRHYGGILPVVPTTFTDDGSLDLESQRRALDCMVDQGVDGACILANFSEQFLLTDEERDTLLTKCSTMSLTVFRSSSPAVTSARGWRQSGHDARKQPVRR